MSVETPTPQHTDEPVAIQEIKDLLTRLKGICSETSFEQAVFVFDENAHLRSQLADLQKELEEKDRKRDEAINTMAESLQRQKKEKEDTANQVKLLEESVKERDQIISEQKETLDTRQKDIDEIMTFLDEEKKKLEQANADMTEVQKQLKEKDELLAKMKDAGKLLKTKFAEKETQCHQLNQDMKALQGDLDGARRKLQDLDALAAGYYDGDEEQLLVEFTAFWATANVRLNTLLRKDIGGEGVQNAAPSGPSPWEQFSRVSHSSMQHHVPLPLSNSDAAKDMRLAVLLAILAREIDRHIFHPTYILSEDSHIRETLVNLAMKDSKKEFFCRQILLSIDPNKEQEILGERIRTVTRNVMRLLSGLPEAFYSEMRDAIEGLATQAGELWSRFRRAERKYEVDFDPLKWGDDEWRPFVFPDQAGAVGESPVARTLSESLLTVFPRICTVEDGIRDAYTFVIELNRSMPQCVAAGKELIREPSSPTSNGRGASNRQRRISIASSSMNGQNGVSLGKKGKQEGSKQG